MPKKKTVNAAKLIKAVESGLPSTEIMAKFGLKTSGQLKSLYVDALAEKGRIKGIVRRVPKAAKAPKKAKEIKVNKRGSLIIPQEMVQDMGFGAGDLFAVQKTKAGLRLKRV